MRVAHLIPTNFFFVLVHALQQPACIWLFILASFECDARVDQKEFEFLPREHIHPRSDSISN